MLVVDDRSRKLIDNTVREDDILNENVTSEEAVSSLGVQLLIVIKILSKLSTRDP